MLGNNKGGIGLFVIGILVTIGLAFGHAINWLLTKGVIWVVHELFNINWYGKFWVVYVLLILTSLIFRTHIKFNKG